MSHPAYSSNLPWTNTSKNARRVAQIEKRGRKTALHRRCQLLQLVFKMIPGSFHSGDEATWGDEPEIETAGCDYFDDHANPARSF